MQPALGPLIGFSIWFLVAIVVSAAAGRNPTMPARAMSIMLGFIAIFCLSAIVGAALNAWDVSLQSTAIVEGSLNGKHNIAASIIVGGIQYGLFVAALSSILFGVLKVWHGNNYRARR